MACEAQKSLQAIFIVLYSRILINFLSHSCGLTFPTTLCGRIQTAHKFSHGCLVNKAYAIAGLVWPLQALRSHPRACQFIKMLLANVSHVIAAQEASPQGAADWSAANH